MDYDSLMYDGNKIYICVPEPALAAKTTRTRKMLNIFYVDRSNLSICIVNTNQMAEPLHKTSFK